MSGVSLSVAIERWPIAGSFTIARGSKAEAVVVVATLDDGTHSGRGECVPYARYGETVVDVAATIDAQASAIAEGLDRAGLQQALPAGAAHNALDCAFWDLEAKRAGKRVWDLAGRPAPDNIVTAYTLSLKSPEEMHRAARAAASRPLLKVKLGGDGDPERIAAVREGAPGARLIADANEGWSAGVLGANLDACRTARVELVEQPLPADDDAALRDCDRTGVLICADESAHDTATLEALIGRYDAINIKLDKTGGLTEALALVDKVREADMTAMVGCMLGTSLAMAPGLVIASQVAFVDLDGPLLLAKDREPGLVFEGSTILTPPPELWG